MPTIPYVATSYSASVSAAQLNNGEAGITNVSYAPAVRVTHNTTQSITSATPTALTFNTEVIDQAGNAADNHHDNTNPTRLTCRYAGVYSITGSAAWATTPATGSSAYIQIRLSTGSVVIARSFIPLDYREMQISTLYPLAVNEYVELMVNQSTGSAININNVSAYSPVFSMVRVG